MAKNTIKSVEPNIADLANGWLKKYTNTNTGDGSLIEKRNGLIRSLQMKHLSHGGDFVPAVLFALLSLF